MILLLLSMLPALIVTKDTVRITIKPRRTKNACSIAAGDWRNLFLAAQPCFTDLAKQAGPPKPQRPGCFFRHRTVSGRPDIRRRHDRRLPSPRSMSFLGVNSTRSVNRVVYDITSAHPHWGVLKAIDRSSGPIREAIGGPGQRPSADATSVTP
jgi:hypothetical protein